MAVFETAVVLQGERAGCGEAGECGVVDDGPAVEEDGEAFAVEGDFNLKSAVETRF